jgi:hypothetical protein
VKSDKRKAAGSAPADYTEWLLLLCDWALPFIGPVLPSVFLMTSCIARDVVPRAFVFMAVRSKSHDQPTSKLMLLKLGFRAINQSAPPSLNLGLMRD